MAKRRNLLTASDDDSGEKKRKTPDSADESQGTNRGTRSKNMKRPNATASMRGTKSAKALNKKISKQKVITERLVPMGDQHGIDFERVVFIDDVTKEGKLAFYRKTEKAEPMPHLWAEFIAESQSIRDQIGPEQIGSFLTPEEYKAINLKANHHIFPSLVTSKGALRSKDNYEASTSGANRIGGKYTKDAATGTVDNRALLMQRAKALRTKGTAYLKQADAYDAAAEGMDDPSEDLPEESAEAKKGMLYIGDALGYSKADLSKYIMSHEDHLTATAERLRAEMAVLAAYVQRSEKRLRDQIQLKVAADLKILEDISKFGRFELKSWQVEALPSGSHICACQLCCSTQPRDYAVHAKYTFPPTLPQVSQGDALPYIKLEDDEDGTFSELISQEPKPTVCRGLSGLRNELSFDETHDDGQPRQSGFSARKRDAATASRSSHTSSVHDEDDEDCAENEVDKGKKAVGANNGSSTESEAGDEDDKDEESDSS